MINHAMMKMAFVVLALAIWTIGSGLVTPQTFGQGNESQGMNQTGNLTGNLTGNQSFSPVAPPGLGVTPAPLP